MQISIQGDFCKQNKSNRQFSLDWKTNKQNKFHFSKKSSNTHLRSKTFVPHENA